MNIGEFCDLETKYCQDANCHVVCLMCQFECKRSYSMWTGSMPPTEYCEDYKQHEYWIAIMRMADKLEGN